MLVHFIVCKFLNWYSVYYQELIQVHITMGIDIISVFLEEKSSTVTFRWLLPLTRLCLLLMPRLTVQAAGVHVCVHADGVQGILHGTEALKQSDVSLDRAAG